jgi:hypothetical protein
MTQHDAASSPVHFWRTAALVLAAEAVTLLALWILQTWFTI